ncbi:MAG TPA: hypothetical protein VFV41_28745 [Streptosporangiaceae bacterium]|nr:hypothetical protein [Streptosporangiaceae bacterium]
MGADTAGTGTGQAAGRARDGHQDYSATPLPRKLGIGEDDELAVIGAPEGFTDTLLGMLADLPEVAARMHTDLADDARYDVILTFVTERAELTAQLPRLRSQMAPTCGLWVAWPKKSSGLPTDMSDDAVREVALPTGLVDNKVCAVNQIWTGLRLVIRRDLR